MLTCLLNYSRAFFLRKTLSYRLVSTFSTAATDSPINIAKNTDDSNEDDDDNDADETEALIRRQSHRIKVRQHVNPLAAAYQQPAKLPEDWIQKAYKDPTLPFIIDIGCAKGGWPLAYAQSSPQVNILGLEIRKPVVEYCLSRKEYWGIPNVHFVATNANVDINTIFDDIKKVSDVEMVTIQFPDPHFKAKHKKRRLVNTEFVASIASNLTPTKRVFLQTDIQELGEYMVEYFGADVSFAPAEGYDATALTENTNPTDTKTEREVATINKGGPVYRMMFVRKP